LKNLKFQETNHKKKSQISRNKSQKKDKKKTKKAKKTTIKSRKLANKSKIYDPEERTALFAEAVRDFCCQIKY
jgi:hypothetical protein